MTTTSVARSEVLAVRLPEEDWDRVERLRAHFATKYPGVTMNVATTIKIALALVERIELGAAAPAAPPSRPRVKKSTTARKR